MKLIKVLPLLLVASLTACSSTEDYTQETFYYFDTYLTMKAKNSNGHHNSSLVSRIKDICEHTDKVADLYKKSDVTGVYDLNHTNEKIEIDRDFYRLLSIAKEAQEVAPYFDPLVGSLSTKWKDSLAKHEVLSDEAIQEELAKINSSSLNLESISGKYYAQRTGQALLDLGAIAKGYVLDRCQDALPAYAPSNDYIVNAGNSSILLGTNSVKKKGAEEGEYVVKIKELSKETYLHLKNSFISTSGISEQKTVISSKTYSHIINPADGSAINLYDAVIVISDITKEITTGSFGDALSTSFMVSSLNEIKETEKTAKVKVIVIKNDSVLYQSEGLELY